jgi:hypothetical protein
MCVGSRVRLVGVPISFEKNFYRLPFTPPSLVRRIGPSARSKLVIKDCVAVIVFNNKEAEKLVAVIKEKIACAESSGMEGHREYDVLSQCLGCPEQLGHVRGVSSYQGWKYAWPQHVEMYRKRKRTKTDASVDTKKIKEQIKQKLVVEMQMQNMWKQRWCGHKMVLSPMTNHASPSLATLKSRCASADNVGLIDGTAELATEVRCDDRTHEDITGMLTEPTLWSMDHVEGASM